MVLRIKKIASPNYSSRGDEKPRMVVLHYTADGGAAVEWFRNPESKASAHYVVARDGSVVQMVDLAHSAWHAGQRGLRGLKIKPNRSSVGIEIVNWGEIIKTSGGFRTWTGEIVPADGVVEVEGRYWQEYTDEQVEAVRLVAEKTCDDLGIPYRFMFDGQPGFTRAGRAYDAVPYYLPAGGRGTNSRLANWRFKGNSGVCGHCHVARTKDDPGPHLDWETILGLK
ncbi:MAG: N-acetylmuramoyl-L-alanine amidase [Candidatus Coatesbacteria bacterium]|nr:MAG: N-acetylmuramoyl-L-alanine amidase [Candidatus Coatesbacteria bacterium]